MAYSDVQSSVSGLLNRRDITNAQIQAYIQTALQRIQRRLRIPAMEKSVIATITAPYVGLVIPSDLLELIDLLNSDGRRLTKEDITTVDFLGQTAPGVPKPQYYVRRGGLWLLGPAPVIGDTISINYYAEFAPLVNPSDTNILTDIASDLLMYEALIESGRFVTDRRLQEWKDAASDIMTDLQVQADDDETSGGATVSPAFYYPEPLESL